MDSHKKPETQNIFLGKWLSPPLIYDKKSTKEGRKVGVYIYIYMYKSRLVFNMMRMGVFLGKLIQYGVLPKFMHMGFLGFVIF